MTGSSSSLLSFSNARVLGTKDALPPSNSRVPENAFQLIQEIAPPSLIYPRTLVRLDHLDKSFFDQTALVFQNHFPEGFNACSSQTSLNVWPLSSPPVPERLPQTGHSSPSNVLLDTLVAPIPTVRRRVHCRNDEPPTWDFARSPNPLVATGLHALVWSNTGQDPKPSLTRNAVSIVMVEPWILTPPVLHSMVLKKGFFRARPKKSKYFETVQWGLPETIWSILYDHCVKVNSRWWVLTSYDQWVFGVFSSGWTSVFVSPVKARDCLQPTVTESLLWWLESAVHEARPNYGYQPPDVPITKAFDVSSQPFPTIDDKMPRPCTPHKLGLRTTPKPGTRYRARSAKDLYGISQPRVRLNSSPSMIPTGLFNEREENPDGPVPFTLQSWQAKMRSISEWRAQATESLTKEQASDTTMGTQDPIKLQH